ncbi:Golgi membrane protein 1 [Astyanax mexicanus]|uniref:Golgi membrane protein 1 n=1 Tax=Astyanax mexicanus TaxID=7994 RepID=A0A8T2LF66_ASTMX|nr:Golgi membrane protein 1 [Astyanax mexicanus]KAG9270383.1 Golgi membrane protein 1 [Astyanax mexicanus]
MMGALVNGRRGGRSPSLLMAALIACVLLLGFNYWVSNSRNVELQAKLLELEERVRQAAAEKEREQLGRNEVEEQLRQQTEQLSRIENTHQRQQQSAQSMWKQEKGNLLLNISSSAKTVQEMKNQMKTLMEDLSKVQKELQSCESNMNTLNKKLTYDMTQCNTQILAQKEECSEKIAAVKQEMQKKYEKQSSAAAGQSGGTSALKATVSKPEVPAANDSSKNTSNQLNTEPAAELKPKSDDHVKTNEILVGTDDVHVKESDKLKLPSTLKPSNQNSTQSSLPNEEAMEGVMVLKTGDLKAADALLDAAVNKEGKEDDAIEYDNEGEIEKRLSKLKDDKTAAQEFEEEMADYNGDDENEPEFEADKQAQLAEV